MSKLQSEIPGANVATLMKAGNFRRITGSRKHSTRIERNRRVIVALAACILALGLSYIVF